MVSLCWQVHIDFFLTFVIHNLIEVQQFTQLLTELPIFYYDSLIDQ